MKWTKFVVHFGLAVALEKADGSERTCKEQAIISLAGPLLHMVVTGGVLIYLTATEVSYGSVFFVTAFISFADAVFNLVIPFKISDGRKAARALWEVARGRGQTAFSI